MTFEKYYSESDGNNPIEPTYDQNMAKKYDLLQTELENKKKYGDDLFEELLQIPSFVLAVVRAIFQHIKKKLTMKTLYKLLLFPLIGIVIFGNWVYHNTADKEVGTLFIIVGFLFIVVNVLFQKTMVSEKKVSLCNECFKFPSTKFELCVFCYDKAISKQKVI